MRERYKNVLSRNIDGILLLDKPKGMSSSFLSNRIKWFFCAKKVGHAGTLDPLATGMLPICLGRATKFSKYLLNSDKRYRVVARLGESTDTFDAHGAIIKVSSVRLSSEKLKQCLESFMGIQNQIPPMFSSLKYRGLPLYKYARRGIDIPRKSRKIHIFRLNLIEKIGNIIDLDIHCSKGTYIRSIINDLGECLGCGAHVIELRRFSVGQYISSSMVSIKTVESVFYNDDFDDFEVFLKLDALLIPIKLIESEYANIVDV